MKRHHVFILCTVGFLLAAAGCVQPVEIAPPEEREVFVKCILMNDTIQQVRLLYTGGIDDSTFVPVEKAEVVVTGPERIDFVFKSVGDGKWEHGFSPRAGATYALHVRIPGREELVATTCFPDVFSIVTRASAPIRWVSDMRDVYEEKVPGSQGNKNLFQFLFPTEVGSFRRYIPSWKESIPDGSRVHSSTVDFQVLDRIAAYHGTTLQQQMPGLAFRLESASAVRLYVLGTITDEMGTTSRMHRLGTNHQRVDRSNLLFEPFISGVDPQQASAPIIIDASYHDRQFDISHNRQIYDLAIRSSYDGQPAYSNYLRILTDSNYDNGLKVYSIIEEYTHQATGLLDSSSVVNPPYLPPGDNAAGSYYLAYTSNGRSFFSIYGDFAYNIWENNQTVSHPSLYFCSVSEEYDLYMQSLRKHRKGQEGDMLTSLYSNVQDIYSNIDGGYGIFAAAHVLRHDCDMQFVRTNPFPGGQRVVKYIAYPAYPAPLPEL